MFLRSLRVALVGPLAPLSVGVAGIHQIGVVQTTNTAPTFPCICMRICRDHGTGASRFVGAFGHPDFAAAETFLHGERGLSAVKISPSFIIPRIGKEPSPNSLEFQMTHVVHVQYLALEEKMADLAVSLLILRLEFREDPA